MDLTRHLSDLGFVNALVLLDATPHSTVRYLFSKKLTNIQSIFNVAIWTAVCNTAVTIRCSNYGTIHNIQIRNNTSMPGEQLRHEKEFCLQTIYLGIRI